METTITLNGKPYLLNGARTISNLIYQLGLESQKVAVECNLEIVPRSVWEQAQVSAGDKIEIINFVGGG